MIPKPTYARKYTPCKSIFPLLHAKQDLLSLINTVGFLPFCRNKIPGLSVEECTPPEAWFHKSGQGAWEWREQLIEEKAVMYGKFFGGKVGFVAKDFVRDFISFRRGGKSAEQYYCDAYLDVALRRVWETVYCRPHVLTTELREICDRTVSFPGVMYTLQQRTDICVSAFYTRLSAKGTGFTWNTLGYATPEYLFGIKPTADPDEAYNRMFSHLQSVLPDAPVHLIEDLLK